MKEEEEEKGHRTWVGDGKKRYVYNCVYIHIVQELAQNGMSFLFFPLSVTLPGRAHIERSSTTKDTKMATKKIQDWRLDINTGPATATPRHTHQTPYPLPQELHHLLLRRNHLFGIMLFKTTS